MKTGPRQIACLLVFAIPLCAVPARAAGPLTILNPALSQMEGGAAAPPGMTFAAGEVLFLSFLVDGYTVSPTKKIKLTYEVDSLDPQGLKLMPTLTETIEPELAPEDKNWKPKFSKTIALAPLGPPGAYKVVIRVKDELSSASATKEVPVQVRAHAVESSPTLVIRNFHFYRNEDDAEPMSPVVYHGGNAVWARFDITGFKLGDGNKKDVLYGIAVLSPSGKVLFSQPEAAVEQSASFYPARYVPGSMNLSLQPNTTAGVYTIAVTVHDRIGNQTIEDKFPFTIN